MVSIQPNQTKMMCARPLSHQPHHLPHTSPTAAFLRPSRLQLPRVSAHVACVPMILLSLRLSVRRCAALSHLCSTNVSAPAEDVKDVSAFGKVVHKLPGKKAYQCYPYCCCAYGYSMTTMTFFDGGIQVQEEEKFCPCEDERNPQKGNCACLSKM
jgi:hypothetical protein